MILHICGQDEWPPKGQYQPASLDTEGFIHCSDYGTVHLPAKALFAGRTDLVLLVIDPNLLDAPVRWEPASDAVDPTAGPWFPHVYGPITERAVVAVHTFEPDAKGDFTLPTALAENRL